MVRIAPAAYETRGGRTFGQDWPHPSRVQIHRGVSSRTSDFAPINQTEGRGSRSNEEGAPSRGFSSLSADAGGRSSFRRWRQSRASEPLEPGIEPRVRACLGGEGEGEL